MGVEKEGVFVYRTIEDLDAIMAYAKKIKQNGATEAAVLGGGLLGLEAAKAVRDLGLNPHVVEFAPRLMPRQLDKGASDMLQSKIEELNIGIHLNKATQYIAGDDCITGMMFAEDELLKVDMLVISAGIKPRDELGRISGLEVGVRGGIEVNNKMQTSDPCIYAIGEVALIQPNDLRISCSRLRNGRCGCRANYARRKNDERNHRYVYSIKINWC